MTPTELILIFHAAATGAMAGLIWFVQVVHYPLLGRVGSERFVEYERSHVRRTGFVVGPLMLVELQTACALPVLTDGSARLAAFGGLALLAVVWLSTVFIQVPCHRRLKRGFDEAAHARLVSTNWIRTVAWTLRLVVALGFLLPATG